MALAKEKAPMVPGLDLSCLEQLVFKGQHSLMLEQEGFSQNYSSLLPAAPSFYDQGNQCMNMNSSLMFLETLNASSQEALPVINFKPGADHWNMHSNSSFLSFDQKISAGEDCVSWIDSMEHDYQMNVHNLKSSSDSHEIQGAGYGLMDNRHGENRFEILYSSMSSGDDLEGISRKDQGLQKRQFLRGDIQASKKICGNNRKQQAKAKSPPTSKDPQSIAARIRREKISERLKVLQDLVPNGTKVDLVTMLEKAISYVKFLQLQVKVLATDEFWPAQGGKAPEVSQVKDAIEAILSSHRGRNNN